MNNRYIIINSKDNCATALEDLPQSVDIEVENKIIKLRERIPFGHKFALKNINKEDYIIKYGEIIGTATKNIAEGEWIHTHNIISSYLKVKNDG